MAWPDFIIIGTGRSGTSALTKFLDAHPEISVPEKEPRYFIHDEEWSAPKNLQRKFGFLRQWKYSDANAYQAMLDRDPSAKVRGEASVQYMIDDRSASRIAEVIPQVKLIVLFRQPVERAYAHFNLNRSLRTEPMRDFMRCIEQEPQREAEGWRGDLRYLHCSRYVKPLRTFLEFFPEEQLRYYLFEDWNQRPQEVWDDLMQFLGTDPGWSPDFNRRVSPTRKLPPYWLVTRAWRNQLMEVFPKPLRVAIKKRGTALITGKFPPLSDALRRSLTEKYFVEEIQELETLIHRDLGHWLR